MATEVTRYVVAGLATGAGNGTSETDAWDGFESASAGLAAAYGSDLVANDVDVTVICSNPNDVDDVVSGNVQFNFVSDATRGLTFENSNPDQPYVLNTDSSTSDNIVELTNTDGGRVTIGRGFRFERDANGSNRSFLRVNKAGLYLDGCTFKTLNLINSATPFGVRYNTGNVDQGKVSNCVFIGAFDGGIRMQGYRTGYKSYNNTFIGCVKGLYAQFGDVKSRNDVFQNCTNDIVDDNGGSDIDYMLTDGTAVGANSVSSSTLTFTDAANNDYSLAAGDTDAIGAGIGPSADSDVPTTDFAGETRSGAITDLGAYIYVTVSALTIDSTDSTMQRGTNFELVCSGATTAPTTANTTLTSGNDTLTPSSVTGSDPYTLTFAVGDLTKQVDATGYDWTLEITL